MALVVLTSSGLEGYFDKSSVNTFITAVVFKMTVEIVSPFNKQLICKFLVFVFLVNQNVIHIRN